jgi:hypothetical protein
VTSDRSAILALSPPPDFDLPARLRSARPGEVITVPPGRHAGVLGVIDQPGITLTSPDAGADFHAAGAHVEGKALLVVRAEGTRLHNIGLHGARVPDGNGAGIRFERGTLTLEHCRLLDNEMGLLSAPGPAMQLVVRHCVFGDAPRHAGPMLRHLLYVGRIASCVVMNSRFFNGWRGHLIKTRAAVNRILWNDLLDGADGAAAYELEFPEGGDNFVMGNRLEQSARTMNPAMLSMGAEARGQHGGRLVLLDNHFVNRRAGAGPAAGRFIHLWPQRLAGELVVEHRDNRFDGPGVIGLP